MPDNKFQETGKAIITVGGLLKGKAANAAAILLFTGTMFTTIGVVASAWDSWGLPRFAYASEVKELQMQLKEFSKNTDAQLKAITKDGNTTRELLLYTRKSVLESELTRLKARLVKEPDNIDLRQRITNKESQLEIIRKELDRF